ncbi:MAG: hypothetical protein ACR2NU_05630 [Aeoliella sp.]
MNVAKWIIALFVVAALYDGILGLTFLFAPTAPFDWFEVSPPNHVGYVQFPAGLLIIFALMFASIARDPIANRGLIPYGILLKVTFCGVSIGHWLLDGIPTMWKPFAIADLVFLVLFVVAWKVLTQPSIESS